MTLVENYSMYKAVMKKKKAMRKPGKVVGKILSLLDKIMKENISGLEINAVIEDYVKKNYSAYNLSSKGYSGFPASVCISVNENIVHGIPTSKVIKNGDLVTVDIVVDYDGWYADAARTYIVGDAEPYKKNFLELLEKLYIKVSIWLKLEIQPEILDM